MISDSVLRSPYFLFENDRTAFDPISFGVVDCEAGRILRRGIRVKGSGTQVEAVEVGG